MEMDIFRTVVPPIMGKAEDAAVAAKLATTPPNFENECQYFYV